MENLTIFPLDFKLLEEELSYMEKCLKSGKVSEDFIESFCENLSKILTDFIYSYLRLYSFHKKPEMTDIKQKIARKVLNEIKRVVSHICVKKYHKTAFLKKDINQTVMSQERWSEQFISDGPVLILENDKSESLSSSLLSIINSILYQILLDLSSKLRERERKLHETYFLLKKINRLLISARDENSLFRSLCHILVKNRMFKFVWVGSLDKEKKVIVPKFSYDQSGLLKKFAKTKQTFDLKEHVLEPIERQKGLILTNLVKHKKNNVLDIFLDNSSKLDLKSEIVCPIKTSDKVVAYLNLYSDRELSNFSTNEKEIFKQIGRNVSFALNSLEKRRSLEEKKRVRKFFIFDQISSNREYFLFQLDKKLKTSRKKKAWLALIVLDIDNFTYINNTFGYAVGDSILKEVENRLTLFVEKDCIYRLGTDEFYIILPDIKSEEEVENFILKLDSLLSKTFLIDGKEVYLTFSFGISLYPKDAKEAFQLAKCAELALFSAKSSGCGFFKFYSKDIDRKTRYIVDLEMRLKKAVEKNEFMVFYQPVISVDSRKVIGAEALLRWYEPEIGFISPEDFIPILEKRRMMKDVGNFVLETVCAQIRLWEKKGLDIKVSCNVSIVELSDKNFARNVLDIVRKSKIDSKHLSIEITETLFMADLEQAMEKFKTLRREGIEISIDDFGKGYSSMTYLKKIPADFLKIDMSFVKALPDSGGDAEIVKAIIQMAKTLNLGTIAEGVERKEQLVLLAGFGCDKVQGFYFEKPVPSEDFERFLKDYKPEKFFW